LQHYALILNWKCSNTFWIKIEWFSMHFSIEVFHKVFFFVRIWVFQIKLWPEYLSVSQTNKQTQTLTIRVNSSNTWQLLPSLTCNPHQICHFFISKNRFNFRHKQDLSCEINNKEKKSSIAYFSLTHVILIQKKIIWPPF
jgi:hypothetical protein